MQGYKHEFRFDSTLYETEILVGCLRCRETWYEKTMMMKSSPRINGPSYRYDYCDKCITEDEKSAVTKQTE